MDFSFQLYSARKFNGLSDLFTRLSALGYGGVEGYGDLYGDGDEVAGLLEKNRLSMSSGHFALQDLRHVARTRAMAEKLGMKTLVCPWLEPLERPRDARGWQALARELERLTLQYASDGLTLAWHNHDFEFQKTAEGEMPMQILLQNAPSMGWQFDVAWAVRAGSNPLDWIAQHGARIVSVHVKDIAPQGQCRDEGGWADLGEGVVNWGEIFAALNRHTRCTSFVLEHDNPSDVLRFASRSIAAARLLGAKEAGQAQPGEKEQ